MYYYYKDSFITVRPGIGLDNYATCISKGNGSWKTVTSPDMPRVERYDVAVNNLHAWAKKKKLKRADCGCCMYCLAGTAICSNYNKKLVVMCNDFINKLPVYYRNSSCDMMERFEKKEVR